MKYGKRGFQRFGGCGTANEKETSPLAAGHPPKRRLLTLADHSSHQQTKNSQDAKGTKTLTVVSQFGPAVPGTGRGRAPHQRRWGPEGARLRRSSLLGPTERVLHRGPRPGFSSTTVEAAAATTAMMKPASQFRLSSGFSVLLGAARTRRGWAARSATPHRRPGRLRRPPS